MAEAITAARRCSCTVCTSITKLEAQISNCKNKGELSASNHLSIQCHMETPKEYDAGFRKNNFSLMELVDNEDLTTEQPVLDEHNDRVTEFLDCLLQQLPVSEKVSPKYQLQMSIKDC